MKSFVDSSIFFVISYLQNSSSGIFHFQTQAIGQPFIKNLDLEEMQTGTIETERANVEIRLSKDLE